MSRRLRLTLAVIGILAIGFIAAAAVFLYTADYNRYKPLIADAITDATGRQVTIRGELTLAMSLPPELAIADVTLANAPWGSQPQMAHVGQLRMSVRILPLLKRDLDISAIRLVDTDLVFETDANGRSNWQFSHKPKSHRGIGLRDVALRQLDIESLAITLPSEDPGSPGARYKVDSLNLTRSAAADSVIVALKGSSNGQSVALSGKTGPLKALFAGTRFPVSLSGDVAGATVKLDGEMANALKLEGLDLTVQASGTDLATLGTGIAVELPETDSFDMTAHLTGDGNDLAVQQARGSVSSKDIKLAISGEIGDLKALEDIQLELKGSGNDLAELSSIVGETLPTTGPFEVSGKVTGSAKTLALGEAQGTISHENNTLSLAGKIDDLIALEGIDLDVKGAGSNLAELSSIVGETLPATGAFKVRGKLTGSAKALAISGAQGTVSQKSMKFSLTGKLDDLIALKGFDLDVKCSGQNLGELRSMLGEKLPDTGPFSAAGRLTGSAKAPAVRNLRATVRHGDSQLTVSGEIGDLLQTAGINLSLEASGNNFGELRPLFATHLPDLGAFSVKGQLSGSDKLLDLKGFTATVDQSDFNGWAKAEFGKRPKITARLESALVDFTRMIQQFRDKKNGEREVEKNVEAKGGKGKAGASRQKLFSDAPLPFHMLDGVDADIAFSARNIKAHDAALEFGELALGLTAGHLVVEKLEATFKGAKLSANMSLTAGNPSNLATRFLVQGFDLGRFLKETQTSQEVDGQVDLAADFKSHGDSHRQLMANLDGVIGAVFGKGQVPRILDLLASDLATRVIPIWGRHKEAGQLNCGVMQFTSQKGVATSDAFLLNTQIGILKGDGVINLEKEQLDFVLSPKPKDASLFSLATNLHVTGSILNPKVRPAKGAVAKKGGKALSALVLGPAGLLTPFMKTGARNKHPCDIQELKNRVDSIYSQTTATEQASK